MNIIQSNIKTMTLKEITDLLDVQHSKAMLKVERIARDPEFGTVSKMDIVYNDRGQTTETYILDKRQSMAVSAVLNTALLMRVIDRWQELESNQAPQIPQTYAAALLEAGRLAQIVDEQAEKLVIAAPKIAFVDNLVDRENLMNATQVGSKHGMSAVKLNSILDELGGVYDKRTQRGRVFTAKFISIGYGQNKKTESGYDQPLFTNAGEIWINEQLINEGVV